MGNLREIGDNYEAAITSGDPEAFPEGFDCLNEYCVVTPNTPKIRPLVNCACVWTPLGYAARSTNAKMVEFLIDHNADMNLGNRNWGKKNSALQVACFSDENEEVVRLLLERDADPSQVS